MWRERSLAVLSAAAALGIAMFPADNASARRAPGGETMVLHQGAMPPEGGTPKLPGKLKFEPNALH